MTERPFTSADLELLRRWDTPSICNALEVVVPARRGRGFTLKPFVAADPGLAPICGLARTGQIRAAAPSGRTQAQDKEARLGWYEYVADADLPTVVVIEDLDETPGYGAFWGEVNSAIHKGLGVLGCVTKVTLRMKRVHSGLLEVTPVPAPNLHGMVEEFEERRHHADYLVGWVDGFAGGDALGRGQIHHARYLDPGEDPAPARTLRPETQQLPESILGLIPKSLTWRLMRPFMNDRGTRAVNWAKFSAGRLPLPSNRPYRQGLVGFSFLLDYVPNWKWAYRPHGLIQYQSFIPEENALAAFSEMLSLSQRRGLPPYLGVFKRHRPDRFLLTHAVDGYSLALDYPVRDRAALWALAHDLDEIVLDAGGRFYFAKDSTLTAEHAAAFLGDDTVARFLEIKKRCDPEGLLQTNLFRRVFGALA